MHFSERRAILFDEQENRKVLRGWVKFPTGGIVRDPYVYETDRQKSEDAQRLIWCDSKTDSTVWMREEKNSQVTEGSLMFCLSSEADKPRMRFIRGFLVTKAGMKVTGHCFLQKKNLSEMAYASRQAEREEKEMNNGLWTSVKDNVVFVLVSVGIAAALMLIAYAAEKLIKKRNHDTERILSTRKVAMIGVFSAIAAVLMLFEFPLPFAPSFYELDFSEIPALVGTFAFGPVAGVMIEFVKILLKLLMKGTSTAFVGDLANFVVGCSFILPASIIYLFKKTRKTAIIGSVTGTLIMTVFGTAFNAIYLLPAFSKLYGLPLDAIVQMGNAVNGNINSIVTLVIFAVAPMNLLKGGSVSLVTVLIYKKLSPILKSAAASGKTEHIRQAEAAK